MGPRTLVAVLLWILVPASARAVEPATQRAVEALRKDSSLKVRAQAALVLGQRGAVDAVPALTTALLEDRAAAVRIAAAAALGRIGDPSANQALESAERDDPDEEVQEAARRALAEIRSRGRQVGDRHSVLVEEAGGRGSAVVRAALREALSRQLDRLGFTAAGADAAAYRIKPSLLSLEVTEGSGKLSISVKASVVAVGPDGRMAAMIEGGARARATVSRPSDTAREKLATKALEAAARTLSEDLAAKLK